MRRVLLLPNARTAAWSICILFTFAAGGLLAATGTSVEPGSVVTALALVLTLAGLHFVYTRLRPDPFVGPIAGGLAIVSWAGFVAGTTALAALRTGAPLIDAWLAHADAILGLDTPALVAWLAAWHFVIGLLEVAYLTTVPLVFATVLILGWTRREAMIWELCVAFAGSAATCTLLSSVVPAVGTFIHYGIAPDVLDLLPSGAGRYHLPIFYEYRSGILDTVDLHHFEGVVTFPSFHSVMALMVAYAVRDMGWVFGLVCAWSGLTLIATIPMGGHYGIDVIAGGAVWASFTLTPRILSAKANQKSRFGKMPPVTAHAKTSGDQ